MQTGLGQAEHSAGVDTCPVGVPVGKDTHPAGESR